MKAVGSGHSWSDVALTDGVMVLPDRMRAVLPLERELLAVGAAMPFAQRGPRSTS
jgi:hypothetical protein